VETAPVRPVPAVAHPAAGKGGLRRGLAGRRRSVILFSDATILTETPPLRACWARVGEQAEVPITGNRAKRVVYGTINVATGDLLPEAAAKWNQDSFQAHLRRLRSRRRGWNIVLFLDRGSPHRAKRSRAPAGAPGVELRWLPTACPERNPLEGLWREIKGYILANEPTPDLDVSLARAFAHLEAMRPRQRLQAAGVLSGSFGLPT
jgi:DDE superfamily endonuclease